MSEQYAFDIDDAAPDFDEPTGGEKGADEVGEIEDEEASPSDDGQSGGLAKRHLYADTMPLYRPDHWMIGGPSIYWRAGGIKGGEPVFGFHEPHVYEGGTFDLSDHSEGDPEPFWGWAGFHASRNIWSAIFHAGIDEQQGRAPATHLYAVKLGKPRDSYSIKAQGTCAASAEVLWSVPLCDELRALDRPEKLSVVDGWEGRWHEPYIDTLPALEAYYTRRPTATSPRDLYFKKIHRGGSGITPKSACQSVVYERAAFDDEPERSVLRSKAVDDYKGTIDWLAVRREAMLATLDDPRRKVWGACPHTDTGSWQWDYEREIVAMGGTPKTEHAASAKDDLRPDVDTFHLPDECDDFAARWRGEATLVSTYINGGMKPDIRELRCAVQMAASAMLSMQESGIWQYVDEGVRRRTNQHSNDLTFALSGGHPEQLTDDPPGVWRELYDQWGEVFRAAEALHEEVIRICRDRFGTSSGAEGEDLSDVPLPVQRALIAARERVEAADAAEVYNWSAGGSLVAGTSTDNTVHIQISHNEGGAQASVGGEIVASGPSGTAVGRQSASYVLQALEEDDRE